MLNKRVNSRVVILKLDDKLRSLGQNAPDSSKVQLVVYKIQLPGFRFFYPGDFQRKTAHSPKQLRRFECLIPMTFSVVFQVQH